MQKSYLMAPGPTPVPEQVALRMAAPAIHHRTPQFSRLFRETHEGLKYLLQTENDVLMLASSGSGAMEGAVVNAMSSSEKAIVINGGKFGERWGKICEAYGLEVLWLNYPWGAPADPAQVEELLLQHENVGAVFVQACDTASTVAHPVACLGKLVQKHPRTLLVVDGITAVGAADIAMDRDGIDMLLVGSQKALMLPPGLACVGVSTKAWEKISQSDMPRFYFDFQKERKALAKDTTAYTPAASLITGLHEVLAMIRQEGLAHLHKRTELLARAARAGLQALGLELLAPAAPAASCSGARLPESLDGKALVRYLRDTMGVTVAGGQDHLEGKIIRINHMGYVDSFDIVTALAALEMALHRFGQPVKLGQGVAAAQEILLERYPS
ncbi:pyridoxal-phosphate-dependent aminotransferase family protein [Desulfurispira natronophila]|uniref:Aspartate aminotransferase-like enzyme n=1 Tax=Desulfurispira natronophila TaxID=682562 RepID=A0A7W7Y556_9BACT|nr:alanine--glyoxylate aminotransferase family protein [Desulfurispira natronophila]MBB5021987.1 aspartate aminotransferase-like enzyme [Desulfurispira natronophila]